MHFEFPKASLANNIVPVHDYIDSHCVKESRSSFAFVESEWDYVHVPFTRGWKFGLLNALKSYEDIFVTRFPLNKV